MVIRAGIFAILAVWSGCERTSESAGPGKREERKVTSPADGAALRKLFDDAAACGDRYHCPPLDALQTRAEQPGELAVLRIAFDIMVDPKVDTGDRLFRMAFAVAQAWATARSTHGHALSAADERELRGQVMRLLARSDNSVPGQSLAAYLSDAREIIEREAIDPKRNNEEVHAAIRILRDLEHDLTTVKAWLSAKDARPQLTGALLLDAFDHDRLPPTAEVPVLLAFAKRHDTDPEAAKLVADHAARHDDAAFAPVLAAFAQHPDAGVREAAAKR